MSKPRNARRSLLEIFRRARRERDVLVRTVAEQQVTLQKQSDFIREQAAAYRELFDQLREVRKQISELKALGLRYGLVCKAADAQRDLNEPLQ